MARRRRPKRLNVAEIEYIKGQLAKGIPLVDIAKALNIALVVLEMLIKALGLFAAEPAKTETVDNKFVHDGESTMMTQQQAFNDNPESNPLPPRSLTAEQFKAKYGNDIVIPDPTKPIHGF